MPVTKRQLAASVLSAEHIAERQLIAAFVLDTATDFSANPFAATSVATVRQVWAGKALEFRALNIKAAGLSDLLASVLALPGSTPLVQEILRSGPHTLNAFHHGDGCRIVGAVLYGKPDVPLPVSNAARQRRQRARPMQLDLFAAGP